VARCALPRHILRRVRLIELRFDEPLGKAQAARARARRGPLARQLRNMIV